MVLYEFRLLGAGKVRDTTLRILFAFLLLSVACSKDVGEYGAGWKVLDFGNGVRLIKRALE